MEESHDAYWDGSSATHPAHDLVEMEARAAGIEVSVTGDYVNSDAYLYFSPDQAQEVASLLKRCEWKGDILDVPRGLSEEEMASLRAIALAEGWDFRLAPVVVPVS